MSLRGPAAALARECGETVERPTPVGPSDGAARAQTSFTT